VNFLITWLEPLIEWRSAFACILRVIYTSDILPHFPLLCSAIRNINMAPRISTDALYIVGLAHAYPQCSNGTQEFNDLITRLYPSHDKNPGY
jgi:hypothetical protein